MNLFRSGRTAAIAVLAALVVTLTLAPPAAAAPVSSAVAAPAWLRLGHFSPDTTHVDVRITSLKGGSPVLELSSVGYGDISSYKQLPEGSYTVAMVAAGSGDWDHLALSATVTLSAGKATTVAAYGPSSQLQVRAFGDDLTAPAPGSARVRVVQASTITPSVDITTTTGVSIVRAAQTGTASAYAPVAAGRWTLQLTGSGVQTRADVTVAAGTVVSLFVLDTAAGGVTMVPILDSAASGTVPIGGVQTGGGFLAHAASHTVPRTPARASMQ